MTTKYGKVALAAVMHNDWKLLGAFHEVRDDGVWVLPIPQREAHLWPPAHVATRLSHPQDNPDAAALPFPFTAADFVAFCKSAPLFDGDCLDWFYLNGDGSLNEAAIQSLAIGSPMAAELVRARLAGDGTVNTTQSPDDVRGPLPEKRSARHDRSLLSVLNELGVTAVPFDKGGKGKPSGIKSRAKQLAMQKHDMSEAVFLQAWSRLPKGKPLTA